MRAEFLPDVSLKVRSILGDLGGDLHFRIEMADALLGFVAIHLP